MKLKMGENIFLLFEEWYEENFIALYNFVSYYTHDTQNAEDLVSEICEKALQNYHQYDQTKGSLSNWIFGIARNCVKNYYRDQSKEENFFDDTISNKALFLSDNTNLPESELEKKEEFINILKAVRVLPKLEQDIIALRYGAGFSYNEIARQLEITIPAVGVLLHRIHKKIKSEMVLEEVKNTTSG